MLEGRKTVAELLRAEKTADAWQARLRTVDGVLAALLADVDTARAELAEVLEYLEAHDDLEAKAAALTGLGLAIAPSDPNRARELLVESAGLFAANDDAWFEALVLAAVGWPTRGGGGFRRRGRLRTSVCPCHGHRRQRRRCPRRREPGRAPVRARPLRRGPRPPRLGTDGLRADSVHHGVLYALEAAARLVWNDNRPDEAARLLGAADGVREDGAVPIWGARLTRFEAFVSSARTALGDEAFEASWAEGRALGFDGALEAAFQVTRPAEATTD